MHNPNTLAALNERLKTLEAEVRIWRAAAVAEDAYTNSRAPAGSTAELALFQRLQTALRQRTPLRIAALADAQSATGLRIAA